MDSLVNESNDDALNINSLRDEVILEIFHYLKQNQLAQIARVCKRWNVLANNPLLWKKVNVEIFTSDRSPTAITKSFINRLPSCVTSIRLFFLYTWNEPLDFLELCVKLQEMCPHLEALILIHCGLSDSLSSVIDLCSQFLKGVKKLIFCDCIFPYDHSISECGEGDISKIEILNVIFRKYFDCGGLYSNKHPFSRMPYLKELRVELADIDDSWFEGESSFLNQLQVLILGYTDITSKTFLAIKNHGTNIKELCLCLSGIRDQDLKFNNSVFPQLKTICLRNCFEVTCEGVVSLLQSCPSLQNVFVDGDVAESFSEHPFVVANRCKSGIVKGHECYHGNEIQQYLGNIRY